MKLSSCLTQAQSKQLYLGRNKLNKPITFKDLPNGKSFTVGKSKKVYKKIGNSHSVELSTNKDAIFLLHNKVHQL